MGSATVCLDKCICPSCDTGYRYRILARSVEPAFLSLPLTTSILNVLANGIVVSKLFFSLLSAQIAIFLQPLPLLRAGSACRTESSCVGTQQTKQQLQPTGTTPRLGTASGPQVASKVAMGNIQGSGDLSSRGVSPVPCQSSLGHPAHSPKRQDGPRPKDSGGSRTPSPPPPQPRQTLLE